MGNEAPVAPNEACKESCHPCVTNLCTAERRPVSVSNVPLHTDAQENLEWLHGLHGLWSRHGSALVRGQEATASEPTTYRGSYATLVGFFREIRHLGTPPLSDERFRQLMSAIEDISEQGEGQVVRQDQELFRDKSSHEQFKHVLPSLGIKVSSNEHRLSDVATCKDFACKDLMRDSRRQPSKPPMDFVEAQQCPDEDITFLNELGYDRSARGDIKADARAIACAFSRPIDLVERYSIEVDALQDCVVAIAEKYNANPYHNWAHALDVFQFSYMAVNLGQSSRYFNFQDVLAMYLANIAHDVAHLGTNNAFLVKAGHKLALTYNDQSPLENMHASLFFETLRKPGMDFLCNMSDHDFGVFRTKIIDSILATDMAKHFELVDRFSARVAKHEDNPFSTDTKHDRERQKASKTDRRMLMQAFIHVADLGHTLRPWHLHKNLVVSLEEEFFAQGDKERELGMPVMPMMDRKVDSLATGQEFFLNKLVRPLVEPYAHFLSASLGQVILENLSYNTRMWAELVEKHGKLHASQIVPLDSAPRTSVHMGGISTHG